jgi:TRAP-type C4-dicarboxylate transport system permease large subunit
MKAFTLVGLIFSAFLIVLGITSKNTAGSVLANAVIAGGLLVLLFVVAIRILSYVKEKKERES